MGVISSAAVALAFAGYPPAFVASIVTTTVLYVFVSLSAVALVDPRVLAGPGIAALATGAVLPPVSSVAGPAAVASEEDSDGTAA